MKNRFFLFIALFLLFTSCKEKHNYQKEIEGKWLCNEVNSRIVPSADAFVCCFNSNMTMQKSSGYVFSTDSSLWVKTEYNYHLEKDEISISGINEVGETERAKYKILVAKEEKLWLENENGVRFTLFRATKDWQQQLAGEWQGFYIKNDDSVAVHLLVSSDTLFEWKENGITTIVGMYVVNGNLLSVNYSTHFQNAYNSYQNWFIEIKDNQLKMVQYFPISGSYNLSLKHYYLERIDTSKR